MQSNEINKNLGRRLVQKKKMRPGRFLPMSLTMTLSSMTFSKASVPASWMQRLNPTQILTQQMQRGRRQRELALSTFGVQSNGYMPRWNHWYRDGLITDTLCHRVDRGFEYASGVRFVPPVDQSLLLLFE